jgi:excisionase family DNA binding protein
MSASSPALANGSLDSAKQSNRLLTADDLAERWQVGTAQVYRLTREGRVPAVRIGRYYRYRASAIDAFEAAGGVAADVSPVGLRLCTVVCG